MKKKFKNNEHGDDSIHPSTLVLGSLESNWYKKSQSIEFLPSQSTDGKYSIIIDFGDYSKEYNFKTKEEAISSAKEVRGKRISDNEWEALGFTVTSSGFTYDDVFIDKYPNYNQGIFTNNRKINDNSYISSPGGSSRHFLGKRDYFAEM